LPDVVLEQVGERLLDAGNLLDRAKAGFGALANDVSRFDVRVVRRGEREILEQRPASRRDGLDQIGIFRVAQGNVASLGVVRPAVESKGGCVNTQSMRRKLRASQGRTPRSRVGVRSMGVSATSLYWSTLRVNLIMHSTCGKKTDLADVEVLR